MVARVAPRAAPKAPSVARALPAAYCQSLLQRPVAVSIQSGI